MRLYFRTEIEANVLGSWTMNVFYHRNIRLWKDCRVYDYEKVKFYRLVACFWTIKWTVKGPSTFEQNSNNENKQLEAHSPPQPHPPGISPPLSLLVWVAGLMLALIFVTISVIGNERKSCCGIRKSWPPTWTRPVLRLTLIHWLRVSNRFPFWGKFVRLTYLRTIMKMTTISPS